MKMSKVKIIAATGCHTGIGHTYIAEESLKKAADKLEVDIKVETHGQDGIDNKLTKQNLQDAYGVIIAADKDVDENRFKGKPTVDVSVSRGIKEAEDLIQQIIDGKARPYKGKGGNESNQDESNGEESSGGIGRAIYKHLMNGVSHMLPFVVGGGVLIAVSFLFGIHSAEPDHESYNQFAELLNNIGNVAFGLMVPILAAFIAQSIAQRPGLVAGF